MLTLLCQRCKKQTVRMGVNLFLDVPSWMYGELSKKNLNSKDTKIMGAGWDRAFFYCTSANCGWNTHLSEVDGLRKELAALKEKFK